MKHNEFIREVHNASTHGKMGDAIFKFVKEEVFIVVKENEELKKQIEMLILRDKCLEDKIATQDSVIESLRDIISDVLCRKNEMTHSEDIIENAEIIKEKNIEVKPSGTRIKFKK